MVLKLIGGNVIFGYDSCISARIAGYGLINHWYRLFYYCLFTWFSFINRLHAGIIGILFSFTSPTGTLASTGGFTYSHVT